MEITDSGWKSIEHLFPKPKSGPGKPGRPPSDYYLVLEGILWVMRTGAPWAEMPPCYPPYSTCFGKFKQWCGDGTLRRVAIALRSELGAAADEIESFIDGSYVPAKRGGSLVGKSRGGKTTKVMALVDSEGLPLSVSVACGNRHDVVIVDQTLDDAFVEQLPQKLIGDKERTCRGARLSPPGRSRERINRSPTCRRTQY